jgi:hypothetical protein
MVPFTGTAPVMNAILAGQIDYDCDPVLGPLAHVRAGTVKALAIATKKRSPLLPDVPTSYEQGMPEFDCAPFYAVFAPKGTPKPIIDKLADAQPPRTKGARRAGEKRGHPADANSKGRNRQIGSASALGGLTKRLASAAAWAAPVIPSCGGVRHGLVSLERRKV